ncbi:winged helix-turn-helix domain-containing protein [Massilia sp. BJB1822]|nr:winged helix-turn-helix domain-containing protein [Massilia sp. BJB1822]
MEVLRYLCRHPGAVIPAEELLQACWGSAEFGDNPVHKAITQLRRALGDSSTEPRYIETIRKRGYRAIAEVVEAEEDGQVVWTSGSPFRGLESFQENHAVIFFGREDATAQLTQVLYQQAANGFAMALVLGPSGSGKTSLVRAGLFPGLMNSNAKNENPIELKSTLYFDCADLGNGSIFQALGSALLDAEINGFPIYEGESAESLGEKLQIAIPPLKIRYEVSKKPIVGLFVDRLEAIFQASIFSKEECEKFISALEILASSNVFAVVMACRNDFYPEVASLNRLSALKARGGHFDLNPPTGADIGQIIRLPAKLAQLNYEVDEATRASLDDVLCDAARARPDALPLLQYCLNELYRQRGDNGKLRFDVFHRLGGIEGAVGVRAEQVITSLSSHQAASLPSILSLLVNIGDEQNSVTARRVPWLMLGTEQERDLVKAMVEARLFVSELAGEVPSFGVAHEAILRRWPRVSDWIERHKHALQLRTRLSGQAERWFMAGQSKDLLLPQGIQIIQAESLLKLGGFSLSDIEKKFIHHSSRRARKADRIRLAIVAAMAMLVVLAGFLGVTARSAQHQAEQHRMEAEELLVFMLGDFVDKLRPIGRLELLDSVSAKALNYLSRNTSTENNQIALSQRAKALQVIAEVNITRSNTPAAIDALSAARSILQKLLKDSPENSELLKNSGANAFWLGQIYFDRNELKKSETFLIDYKKFSERLLYSSPKDVASIMELSYAHNSLGSLFLKKYNYQEAASNFEKSMSLKKQALDISPDDETIHIGYANSLSWLANTKVRLGRLIDAKDLYHKEISLLKRIEKRQLTNTLLSSRLALALWNRAELNQALGYSSAAADDFEEAESKLLSLTKFEPENKIWQKDFFAIKSKKLKIKQKIFDENDRSEAILLHEEFSKIVKTDPKREELAQLFAVSKINLAYAISKSGIPEKSKNTINDALEILNTSNPVLRGDLRLIAMIAEALLARSDIESQFSQQQEAIKTCEEVQKILTPFSVKTLDFSLLSPLARAYTCTGNYSAAATLKKKLDSMFYKDQNFIGYISTHQRKRGT